MPPRASRFTPHAGDCYPAAFHYVEEGRWEELGIQGVRAVYVVHGWPTLQRPPYRPYGHAWVEVAGDPRKEHEGLSGAYGEPLPDGLTTICVDASNGKWDSPVALPRIVYYGYGKIDARSVRRYTLDEAVREAMQTGMYGPWNEDTAPENVIRQEKVSRKRKR